MIRDTHLLSANEFPEEKGERTEEYIVCSPFSWLRSSRLIFERRIYMPRPSKFDYKVLENIACLSGSGTNYRKELRRISWNEQPETFDLRMWHYNDAGQEFALRGTTLTDSEMEVLIQEMLKYQGGAYGKHD